MIAKLPSGFSHPMEIGGGAFASVFRARQVSLDRWVAIKLLKEKDSVKRRKLLREARTQAKLRIACIPQVYDAFEWRGNVCIVMQWVKGVSLKDLLETDLTLLQRLWLVDGIVGALAALHGEGYAHRDIKPANILVSPTEGITLVDFGFTKHVLDGERSVAGFVKGTPAYLAPELWRSDADADLIRADIYAAGKVLRQVINGGAIDLDPSRMMAEDPGARPASGIEVLDEWRKSNHDLTIEPVWDQIATPLLAGQLSDSLLGASRQLLYAGRYDEAYWLLVECLEEDPDHADAIALMNSFPSHKRARRRRRNVVAGVSMTAAMALVVASFFLGRQSKTMVVTLQNPVATSTTGSMLFPSARPTSVFNAQRVAFLEEKTPDEELLATVIIEDIPATGALYVGGTKYGNTNELVKGIAVGFGRHILVWRNEAGKTLWRESVSLLPFQVKRLSLSGVQ